MRKHLAILGLAAAVVAARADGSLEALAGVAGLPAGAVGLAAF